MIMKKKYIVMVAVCLLLIAAGICYSVAYFGLGSEKALITTLNGDGTDRQNSGQSNPPVTGTAAEASSIDGLSGSDEIADIGESTVKPSGTGEAAKENSSDADSSADIYVHLCGAVKNPSVYRTASGTRLVELIELAGGLTEDAAGDYINQAMTVVDGQRIYIPTNVEVEELPAQEYITTGGSESPSEESKLIDINNAVAGELMELPGIGQAKADSIIAYREASGGFQTIDELMKVPGIKEGLFSQISAYIMVK